MATEGWLRLGLIGTGGISQHAHIPAWQQVPGVRVVALAEPVAQRRQQALRLLGDPGGERIRAYADFSELLAQEELDLVDIAMRAGEAKYQAIRAALQAGCHITCQKPFALDLGTARTLVAEAQEAGRILSVNQQARWAGAFALARRWVEEGRLGPLRTVQLWADFPNAGADQWIEYSVHSFDLIRFWAGREPRRVLAWHKRQTPADHYLLAVWLDFDGELAAQVWDEMSSSTMLRWGFRLMGERGSLRGHEAFSTSMVPAEVAFAPAGAPGSETVTPVPGRYVPDAFAAYFRQLVAAIRGEVPVPTPAADNLRTLALAFAARESFRSGRWVEVEQA